MKKWLLFVMGILVGILLLFIAVLVMEKINENKEGAVDEYFSSIPEVGTYYSNGVEHTFIDDPDVVNNSGASNENMCTVSNEAKAREAIGDEADKALAVIYDYNIRLDITDSIEFTYLGEENGTYKFGSVYGEVVIFRGTDIWEVVGE